MENINIKRVYAFLTDSIISSSIGMPLFAIINLNKEVRIGEFVLLGLNINLGYSLQILVTIFYFVLFDFLNNGKTFGKLIFSIIVVDKISLAKLSLQRSLERTIFKIISILILPISIILFLRKNNFTIQDKWSKTTTIFTKKTGF